MEIKIIRNPIIRAFISTAIGSGLSKFLLVVLTFVCARNLSKEDFGTFSFFRNTLQVIFSICALSYCNLCTKFSAESENDPRAKNKLYLLVLFSVCVCVLFGLIILLSPDVFLSNFIENPFLFKYFRYGAFLLGFLMIQPLIDAYLRGKKKFKLIGCLQVLSSSVFLISAIVLLPMFGLSGAIRSLFIYYIFYTLICIFVLIKYTRPIAFIKHCFGQSKSELYILRDMVLPMFLLSFIEAPTMWLAQVLISKYDSYGAVGSMTAIMQIRNLLILIPMYFFSTFTSFAATLYGQRNFCEYFRKYDKTSYFVRIACVSACLVASLLSPYLLELYGPEYKEDVIPFVMCMFSLPFLIQVNLLKTHMMIMEHQQYMLKLTIVSSVIYILSIYCSLNIGINSVISFYIGQIFQIFILYIGGYMCYLKDKKICLKK